MTEHRQQCPTFDTQPNDIVIIDNQDDNDDDSSSHDPNVELTQNSLFDSCPSNRHNDLQTLVNQNTPPAILNATILRWHAEASNANTNDYDDL